MFKNINHPAFPSWLCESLDGLFLCDHRIQSVSFELTGRVDYDDSNHTTLTGYANIFTDPPGCMTEEEFDMIPYVRRLERRAVELWQHIPITYSDDSEFYVNEYDFTVSRKSIKFKQDNETYEGFYTISIEIEDKGNGWEYEDSIKIPDYEGSYSDLLVKDAQSVLDSYDLGTLGLDKEKNPKAKRVYLDQEENIVIILEQGELARCFKKA